MTSVDDMASEIMKGLQEYADLADTEMKKSCPKDCDRSQERDIFQCTERHWCLLKKLGNEKGQ